MRRPLLAVLLALAVPAARGQRAEPADTLGRPRADSMRTYEAAPVVVTATRTARALSDVPVPTTVVTRAQIDAQRPLRLSDLLAEQPGLALFETMGGAGLQVQGFDPDYTLVLIDGEPVVGRTAGTLDLDRLTVAGVERVEIVRGPTSSRYGSDALAGVVNIITRRPGTRTSAEVTLRGETHGTTDVTLQGETGSERAGVRVQLNRLGSSGYDVRPDTPGLTSPSFTDLSGSVRLRARPFGRTDVGLTVSAASQRQSNVFGRRPDATSEQGLGADAPLALYDERGRRREWSVTPTLSQRLSARTNLTASLHGARFATESEATGRADGDVFDATDFDQTFGKAEATLAHVPSGRLALYAGGGAQREAVGGDRYAGGRSAVQAFAFAEAEWAARPWLDVNASARYDRHTDYAPRVSPKASLLVKPAGWLRLRGSVGSGFKAPAFRQLYLTFTNATAGGYSVFGASEARERLAAFEAEGALERYLIDPATLQAIRAENSVSYSAGAEAAVGDALTVKANAFHNEVRDLIETQAVAIKTNGQSVFTYFNLARIYTRGVEAELAWRPAAFGRALGLSASYQFLDAADRSVLSAIDAGRVYARDAENRDVRLARGDYGGLLGRSRHSGTLKLDAAARGYTGTLRLIARSRYGDRDVNGNAVLDDAREYVPGYATVHATLARTLGRADVTVGARNLLGYTDPGRVPALAGRLLFAGVGYRF